MTLEDLILMHTIIAAMTQRGVVRPEEMVAVGTLYEKLGNFINEINSSDTSDSEFVEPEDPPTPEDEE